MGGPEILLIVIVALVVFGPERLPELARKAGNLAGEAKRMANGFQTEMTKAASPAPAPTSALAVDRPEETV